MSGKLVLVDTDVLEHTLGNRWNNQANGVLLDIEKDGFQQVVSEVTIHELRRGANKRKRDRVMGLLDQITAIPVNREIWILAADYYGWCQCYSGIKVSEGDSVLAATSILTRALLLTANRKHFISPYFQEVKAWLGRDIRGGVRNSMFYYALANVPTAIQEAQAVL